MTPESRWGWSLSGCDVVRYEQLCERVEVVRTVELLAGITEEFVHDRSGRPRVPEAPVRKVCATPVPRALA